MSEEEESTYTSFAATAIAGTKHAQHGHTYNLMSESEFRTKFVIHCDPILLVSQQWQ